MMRMSQTEGNTNIVTPMRMLIESMPGTNVVEICKSDTAIHTKQIHVDLLVCTSEAYSVSFSL